MPATILGQDILEYPDGLLYRRTGVWTEAGVPYSPHMELTPYVSFWAGDPDWIAPVDGAAVASWRDGTGGGKDVAQAIGAEQPTFRTAVPSLRNRPALQFDGGDSLNLVAGVALAAPYSILAVIVPAGDTDAGMALGTRAADASKGLGVGVDVFALDSLSGASMDPGRAYIVRGHVTTTTSTLYANEVEVASGPLAAVSIDALRVGLSLTGHVAFLAVYAGDVSAQAGWPDFIGRLSQHYAIILALDLFAVIPTTAALLAGPNVVEVTSIPSGSVYQPAAVDDEVFDARQLVYLMSGPASGEFLPGDGPEPQGYLNVGVGTGSGNKSRLSWIGGRIYDDIGLEYTRVWRKAYYDTSTLRMATNGWCVVDGVVMFNANDGLRPKPVGGTMVFRQSNCWTEWTPDDGIENEGGGFCGMPGIIEDSIFLDTFMGYASRGNREAAWDGVSKVIMRRGLTRLGLLPQLMPGEENVHGFILDSSGRGHGHLFKMFPESPPVEVTEWLFVVPQVPYKGWAFFAFPPEDGTWAPSTFAESWLLWKGPTPVPAELLALVPPGITVTTDLSVEGLVLDAWKTAHGLPLNWKWSDPITTAVPHSPEWDAAWDQMLSPTPGWWPL